MGLHGVFTSARTVQRMLSALYFIGVSGRYGRDSHAVSRLALPLVVVTHYVPNAMLFVWLTTCLDLTKFRDSVPALYSGVTALGALANFVTYKLFPMATHDAECQDSDVVTARYRCAHDCSGSDVRTVAELKCHTVIDLPPAYQEKPLTSP